MNWQIGDKAVIIKSITGANDGKTTTVLSCLYPAPNDGILFKAGDMVHRISARSYRGGPICITPPSNLRPIPDSDYTRYHTEIAEKGPCVYEFKEVCNVDIS